VTAPTPAAPDIDAVLAGLIARIAAGEVRAVAELYDASLPLVWGLVLRLLRNPADAEEVIGDLYLQVWERARDFDPGRGGALAWLRTLAWSRAVDRQRRQRRHALDVPLHPDDDAAAYASMACEDLEPEAAAEAWSSAQAVRAAFDHLSDIQRRILTLAFQQDMSHHDIALATGLPLGTVKSHARRGLQALRAVLEASHA
jgi:RNA polymerase sigma-70 factor, ECF subfamily